MRELRPTSSPSLTVRGATVLLFWITLVAFPFLNQAQQTYCTLCQDGSFPINPDGVVVVAGDAEMLEWKCIDLHEVLLLLGVDAGGQQCTLLQFSGFANCGCPTFTHEDYCALCPAGFFDLPAPDTLIPGFDDLTCRQIIYAPRDGVNAPIKCYELERYQRLCQCPDQCSLCRYSDEYPTHLNRSIPYLTHEDNHVTCGDLETAARARSRDEACFELLQPPVAVDVQGYCGCPQTGPNNACSLCPLENQTIINPDLVVPNVGGLNCLELEEYLSYVTDPNACNMISSMAEACCTTIDPCPICPDGTNGVGAAQIYKPYGLGCNLIGQAPHYGYPDLTCEMAQQRFPYFCRCVDTLPTCTICELNLVPPFPNRYIPFLNMTCGEANDFVSLRTAAECHETLQELSVDVAAFCGCSQDTSLRGRCRFCPPGETLITASIDSEETIFFGHGAHSWCAELENFALYIVKEDLCLAVQKRTPECCQPEATDAPTFLPTFSPTLFDINGTLGNGTDDGMGNETMNETIAPTIDAEGADEDSAIMPSAFFLWCGVLVAVAHGIVWC